MEDVAPPSCPQLLRKKHRGCRDEVEDTVGIRTLCGVCEEGQEGCPGRKITRNVAFLPVGGVHSGEEKLWGDLIVACL